MGSTDTILMVVHAFLPRSVAGTEIHAYHLARHLSRRHKVHILHGDQDRALPHGALVPGSYRGIPLTRLIQNYPYRGLDAHQDPAIDRAFKGLLTSLRPSIVHIHHLSTLSLGLPKVAKSLGIPVALTLHDYWMMCPSGGQLAAHPDGALCDAPLPARCAPCFDAWRHREGALESLALKLGRLSPRALPPDWPFRLFQALPAPLKRGLRSINPPQNAPKSPKAGPIQSRISQVQAAFDSCDAVISPSRYLLDQMTHGGFNLPQGRHIPNGTPDPWAKAGEIQAPPSISHQSPAQGRPLRFLHIGTLVKHKGTDVLVDAARHLDPAQATLDIYGPTDMFPAYTGPLVEAAKSIPALTFKGPLPMDQVHQEMARSDALLHGARWAENAPLTLLEARANHLPVIAPRIGGIPEQIIDGENGLLYEPGDPASLASAMRRFIEDADLRAQLRRPSHEPVTAATNAQNIAATYEEILGRPLA